MTNLQVLDRMKEFVVGNMSDARKLLLNRGAACVLGSVVALDCVGIVANFAAAFYWSQASQRQSTAALFLEQRCACCAPSFALAGHAPF